MRAIIIPVITLAVSCYRPRFEDACAVSCDFTGDRTCPAGLECESDSLCHHPGVACGPPSEDAAARDAKVDASGCVWSHFGSRQTITELAADGIDFADPTVGTHDLEMLFVRKAGTTGYDIFGVTRSTTSGPWMNEHAVSELNTGADEVDPALTADGLDLFFIRDVSGTRRAMEAVRMATNVPFTVKAGSPIASVQVQGLDISADGLTLYYTVNSVGKLWMVKRPTRAGVFTGALAVGTVGTNIAPSISADQLELFLQPSGSGVIEWTRTDTGQTFMPPDIPIDSGADNPEISGDGTTLFISTGSGAAYHTRSCL